MYKYNLYNSWEDNSNFWNNNIKDCSKNINLDTIKNPKNNQKKNPENMQSKNAKNKKLNYNINIIKENINGKYTCTNNLSKNRNRKYQQLNSNNTKQKNDTDSIFSKKYNREKEF
jgi:hypothetical protein